MKGNQALTMELLIILGVILVMVSPIGSWLAGLVDEITVHHDFQLNFNPFAQGTTKFNSAATSGSSGDGGGQNNALVGHFDVPLEGGGSINVNASSQSAAEDNVRAQGGTPATA
jgi:hypothetical protein